MVTDMKELFKNCLEVTENDSGFSAMRLTQNQLDYYKSLTEQAPFFSRGLCGAGVKLEFALKSKGFSFKFAVGKSARPFGAFDLYEDGVLTKSFSFPNISRGEVAYEKRSPSEALISVFLPQTVQLFISDFSGDTKPAPSPKKKYLALGDDVSQGMVASRPSMSYTTVISRYYDFDLLNQAIGGDIFRPDALDPGLPFVPDVVTVLLGNNDVMKIPEDETIYQTVTRYFKALNGRNKKAIVNIITPIWRAEHLDSKIKPRFMGLSRFVADEAAKYKWNIIDGLMLVPHEESYFVDGAHPNDLGFNQLAINLTKYMKV